MAIENRSISRRSRGIAALALAVAASLAASETASGTTTDEIKATCPVCGKEFQALEIMSTNNFGGMDRDFFGRARGEQPIEISIWTCPACLFSGFKGEFEEACPEDLKKNLPPALASLRKEWKDEKDPLPSWRRYELAEKVAELRGDPVETRGWLALRSAWCVRLAKSLPTGEESAAWAPEQEAIGTPGMNDWLKDCSRRSLAAMGADDGTAGGAEEKK